MIYFKFIAAISAVALAGTLANAQEEDDRVLLNLDTATQMMLLKDMRGLTESLDSLLAALSEGDFDQVTRLGQINLGFGHDKLMALVESGASDTQIQAMRAKMKANRQAREESGVSAATMGGAMFGIPKGVGQKMPEDFRLMGQAMHAAAEDMVSVVEAIGDTPTVADYQAVLEGVQGITSNCVACHGAFRIR